MNKKVKAFAPASIANLNCGFDVLGLALEGIGDHVEVCFNDSHEIIIKEIVGGDNLPMQAQKNTCGVVALAMLEEQNIDKGVDIRIEKGFIAGSGLGSSAASSAATAKAMNELLGSPYSEKDLVRFTGLGENLASGTFHCDNASPAVLGGITFVRNHEPIDVLSLPVPKDLLAVVLFPHIQIKTKEAREMLPKQINLKEASKQWANLGGFVASLYQQDFNLMKRSLQDLVIEPVRSKLIPQFEEMKKAALNQGAIGFGISGSGPSVFALAKGGEAAQNILNSLDKIYEDLPYEYQSFVSRVNHRGAYIEQVSSISEQLAEVSQK